MVRYGAVTIVVLIALTSVVAAQVAAPATPAADKPAPAAPAAQPVPASGTVLGATVVSVTGQASKSRSGDPKAEWTPIQVGEHLDEMTIIRTGLGAQVVLKVAGRSDVTIGSGTKIGLGEMRQSGQIVKAELGLKYGAIRADVGGVTGTNDFQVATPVAVLSVRGSEAKIAYSSDMGFAVQGYRGAWAVQAARRSTTVRPGQRTDGKLTPSTTLATAKRDTKLGDCFGGLTNAEAQNLAENGDGRGILGFTGGTSDVAALIAAQFDSSRYGKPVVIPSPKHTENRR